MDNRVTAVIHEYEARMVAERKLFDQLPQEEINRRRDEWLLPVGESTATLMSILIREGGCRRILEVGTSYGYSTVYLAEAARAVDGTVVTLELQKHKADYARESIARAGLSGHVEFRVGDALESLGGLSEPFDFVLVDLWKDLYVPVWNLLYPRLLAPGAIMVADNMLIPEWERPNANAYRERVRGARGMASVLLPVGFGIELSRYEVE